MKHDEMVDPRRTEHLMIVRDAFFASRRGSRGSRAGQSAGLAGDRRDRRPEAALAALHEAPGRFRDIGDCGWQATALRESARVQRARGAFGPAGTGNRQAPAIRLELYKEWRRRRSCRVARTWSSSRPARPAEARLTTPKESCAWPAPASTPAASARCAAGVCTEPCTPTQLCRLSDLPVAEKCTPILVGPRASEVFGKRRPISERGQAPGFAVSPPPHSAPKGDPCFRSLSW
jgi:hypothetical protein